ncbi:MAG: EAL domain-containing protein [Gammaproteobacteria bacterium]|nr:EAL domain-containing protein [Gammaproteobacteria bacterium]
MARDKTVRILVVEESLNDAESLLSVLRNAGHAVRPMRAAGEQEVQKALEQQSFDLVLCSMDLEGLTLHRVHELLAQTGKDVALVGVTREYTEPRVTEAMESGAHDLVGMSEHDHLRHAAARELAAVGARREWRRADQARREAEKRCAGLLDRSRDAVAYVQDGMHMYANPAYLGLFGFDDPEEIEGTPVMDMIASDQHDEIKDYLRRYCLDGETKPEQLDVTCRRVDGSTFSARMEFSPANIENEACTQILIRDRSQDQTLESRLKDLTKQDLLTGLYNRQHFMAQLEQAVSKAVNDGGNSALLYIELDTFKALKDSVGVAGTDLVINDVAGLIKQRAGEHDLAARFSDSAFTVLALGKDAAAAETLGESLRAGVEAHIAEVGGQSVTTTCSIGISPIGETSPAAQELVHRADRTCQQAHEAGGNRVAVYNPVAEDMAAREQDKVWVARMREALDKDRLRLHYQPIANLHGEEGEKHEVLVRMLGKDGEVWTPGQFLPAAESHGLITRIDRWVIARALKVLGERSARSQREATFFIKLSGPSLADQELLPWLAEQLKTARVQASHLVVEVPEATAVSYLKAAKQFVKGLKELRCGFALEQFGAGANSFHTLKHLPADYIKIDRSFMQDLPSNQENQEAVRTLTETAHSMNKLVIAEFVENANALAVLWQLGVNYIQGHFLQEASEELGQHSLHPG